MRTQAARDQAIDHLDRLAERLWDGGLAPRVDSPSGRPPRLHVMNPRVKVLGETVYASEVDSTWFYWWSWAERICPCDQVDEAAGRITRVLAETS